MKAILFCLFSYVTSAVVTDQSSCNSTSDATESDTTFSSLLESARKIDSIINIFLPLSVGNFWVYRDSIWESGKLMDVTDDTLRITEEGTYLGHKTYRFNDGKTWFASGDTIFQVYSTRGGGKIHAPVLMASGKPTEFNSLFGGDVVIHKTVSKMETCPIPQWGNYSCYKVKGHCDSYQIVAYGIGIIWEVNKNCGPDSGNYSTRTLVSYSFN